jgi:beta-aspartyl-peptidase (threonine type)
MSPVLALHGGAGASRKLDYTHILIHLRGVVELARDRLRRGDAALDVAVAIVAEMELSGLYVAGRGGSPNLAGEYELDAALMDGRTGAAGAVGALQGFQSPIAAARRVMERTEHVFLVGKGAADFARMEGLPVIPGEGWFTHAGAGEANFAPGRGARGTVGCAVLDAKGHLAAATSSAGVFDKLPGRIGDSPVIGAGTWADAQVAISCTGSGEAFLRTAAAAQIAWRRSAGEPLAAAASGLLDRIAKLGGEGGVAAVDRDGAIALPFNAEGMKRAWLTRDGEIGAAVFD